ncbi:GntR family transcriptional regulator [Nocardioides coralli]|uniref:GntR family transcriptional regulator n=1 Tax=Nocardioides coralli TaxID=2872154 RepID=UPI001CA43C5E|nr:GntR family transcriptional regulator [Nocardioides coralli]QZY30450.1 GntR family transcriptional regulator [Nocardioides coralli]
MTDAQLTPDAVPHADSPLALPALPQQRRVADSVHDTLRQAIIGGQLAPGSRLSVPVLAQQLEVSRSPVREAVQRLVQEGLATEEPRRGAGVAVLDPDELVPLYEIREVLEGLAARLAAQHATDEELDRLASAHRAHAEALERGEASHHAGLDMAFHAQLREASHNPELHGYLERVQGRIAIAILGGNPVVWSQQAIVEHQAILDAVLARDAAAAEDAARSHVQRVRHDISALQARQGGAE